MAIPKRAVLWWLLTPGTNHLEFERWLQELQQQPPSPQAEQVSAATATAAPRAALPLDALHLPQPRPACRRLPPCRRRCMRKTRALPPSPAISSWRSGRRRSLRGTAEGAPLHHPVAALPAAAAQLACACPRCCGSGEQWGGLAYTPR